MRRYSRCWGTLECVSGKPAIIQLRDLDLASGTLVVRSGKGGKSRRLPLHSEAQRILARYLQEVRCPEGLPPIGGEQERALLLVGM